ncbi:MAG: hypothetical protein J0L92_29180 [Deltaproteobacteria bacterium]|nr:hypothetical protein [Deltaproteobacteria bacterium]
MRVVEYLGIVLVVIVGCGGREERLSDGAESRTSGNDRTSDPQEDRATVQDGRGSHAACPAAFTDRGPSCQGDDVVFTECAYAEGSCTCGEPAWCGGAAPIPRPQQWICRPHRPTCARDGSPCDTEGASCALDDCGFVGVRCVGGTWQSYDGPYPP